MAQRKEIKKNVKPRDLKPKKDAKGGGHIVSGQRQQGPGRFRPGQGNT